VRALTLPTILLVIGAPLAGALLTPQIDLDDAGIALFPPDITDADVLALLAASMGLQPARLPVPLAPSDADVGLLAQQLGARADLRLSEDDIAAFRTLDPLVAQPTATLILATLQAWDLRDAAFAGWTMADYALVERQMSAGEPLSKVLTPDQMEMLLTAAIMLSDTIESIVIPQLEFAAQAGVWPPIAVADPVGVLRIGSSGNDLETVDRIIQLDGRGNDVYKNNAGGAVIAPQGLGVTVRPIAVSIDLSGHDTYEGKPDLAAQGGGDFGIGLLYDLAGDDSYWSDLNGAGSGGVGIGIFRDTQGSERYQAGQTGLGAGIAGFGYFRDDEGDDVYRAGHVTGGYGTTGGLGVFWDRGGVDEYGSMIGSTAIWGWAQLDGKGWFVEETASEDAYVNLLNPSRPHPRACNTCTWIGGNTPGGRGNDNYGGLAYLIAKQDP